MWVNGDYTNGISVLDRIAARAYECKKVADAMDGWLNQLAAGSTGYAYKAKPGTATAYGLTEAPRGALGHWITIAGGNFQLPDYYSDRHGTASPRRFIGPIGSDRTGACRNADYRYQPADRNAARHPFV